MDGCSYLKRPSDRAWPQVICKRPNDKCSMMFGKTRFLGLKGTKLNIAIGFIAGLDFMLVIKSRVFEITTYMNRLFGYDQGVMGLIILQQCRECTTNDEQAVY